MFLPVKLQQSPLFPCFMILIVAGNEITASTQCPLGLGQSVDPSRAKKKEIHYFDLELACLSTETLNYMVIV